jgi:hypothetical protein
VVCDVASCCAAVAVALRSAVPVGVSFLSRCAAGGRAKLAVGAQGGRECGRERVAGRQRVLLACCVLRVIEPEFFNGYKQ